LWQLAVEVVVHMRLEPLVELVVLEEVVDETQRLQVVQGLVGKETLVVLEE
jgi:hypothetical protein